MPLDVRISALATRVAEECKSIRTALAGKVDTADARLSDQRTPTNGSVTNAKVAGAAGIEESKLALASDAAAGTASRRTLGSGATQAAAGNHAHDLSGYVPTTQRALIGGADSSSGSGTWTPNAATASEHRRTATGATTVNLPTNGVDTQLLRLWFQASGADRVVTFASGYEVTQPVPGRVFTIPSGTWGEVLTENRGGTWVLLAAYPQAITVPDHSHAGNTANATSGSGTWNITLTSTFTGSYAVSATGNITIGTPTGAFDGQRALLEVYASGGTRTVTIGSGFKVMSGLPTSVAPTNGNVALIGLYYSTRGGYVITAFNVAS